MFFYVFSSREKITLEKVIITIFTVNDAFDERENDEVARILRELADKLESNFTPRKVLDLYGNVVGSIQYN